MYMYRENERPNIPYTCSTKFMRAVNFVNLPKNLAIFVI